MMFSSVNTYNFHSNVKEIKKISVNRAAARPFVGIGHHIEYLDT